MTRKEYADAKIAHERLIERHARDLAASEARLIAGARVVYEIPDWVTWNGLGWEAGNIHIRHSGYKRWTACYVDLESWFPIRVDGETFADALSNLLAKLHPVILAEVLKNWPSLAEYAPQKHTTERLENA